MVGGYTENHPNHRNSKIGGWALARDFTVKVTPQVILNTTRNLAYNYNVLAVNCEQDWKVSGHCSISVVSPRNAKKIMVMHHIVYSSL